MFCQLFGVEPGRGDAVVADKPAPPNPKKAPKAPKVPKAPKAPKKKGPLPKATTEQQECAPFDHIEEASPEPAEILTLQYEDIDVDEDAWLEEEHGLEESDTESNYEATSMTEEDLHPALSCSVDSSPGFLLERPARTVKVDKKRPPGIAVTFDDDAWIE
jgi:hypothetical protein